MSLVGVLSNVHSRRNSRSMADVHAVVSAHKGVRHVVIHRFAALADGLAALARQGVEHLVVSGGDGTVHAVVTELINRSPFAKPPRLSILAGGTTNVIARDVASLQPPAWALKQLLERDQAGNVGEVVERRTIALSRSDGQPPIHGFVTGAIGFYQGTLLTKTRSNLSNTSRRMLGGWAVFWTLGRVAYHGFGEKSGIRAERVGIAYDQNSEHEEDLYLLLATTLHSLIPGLNPFWGEGPGAIRLTTIAKPGDRFMSALWSIVRMTPQPWMEQSGYRSIRVDRARVRLSSPFIMDGEIVPNDSEHPVELSSGPLVAFTRY